MPAPKWVQASAQPQFQPHEQCKPFFQVDAVHVCKSDVVWIVVLVLVLVFLLYGLERIVKGVKRLHEALSGEGTWRERLARVSPLRKSPSATVVVHEKGASKQCGARATAPASPEDELYTDPFLLVQPSLNNSLLSDRHSTPSPPPAYISPRFYDHTLKLPPFEVPFDARRFSASDLPNSSTTCSGFGFGMGVGMNRSGSGYSLFGEPHLSSTPRLGSLDPVYDDERDDVEKARGLSRSAPSEMSGFAWLREDDVLAKPLVSQSRTRGCGLLA
ncbi:hypothetical protein BD410DRAFT_794068 [Rickenella mellea]|uniref:Uncharacterized protein n=1 Tax=Rickenella mellea TaxID=50990 RepID=A0A4Y7PQP2_9AGAM|nr:hypothetical protein BD410DRAFT_794068 [Rickenella mellea]